MKTIFTFAMIAVMVLGFVAFLAASNDAKANTTAVCDNKCTETLVCYNSTCDTIINLEDDYDGCMEECLR